MAQYLNLQLSPLIPGVATAEADLVSNADQLPEDLMQAEEEDLDRVPASLIETSQNHVHQDARLLYESVLRGVSTLRQVSAAPSSDHGRLSPEFLQQTAAALKAATATPTLAVYNMLHSLLGFSTDMGIMITHKCSLGCSICVAEEVMTGSPHSDFPLDLFHDFVLQLNGFERIFIEGGEPLAYGSRRSNTILDVLRLAAAHIKEVFVVTNGFFLPREQALVDVVLEQFPDNTTIILSIDTFHQEEIEKLGGSQPAIAKSIADYIKRKKRLRVFYNLRIPASKSRDDFAFMSRLLAGYDLMDLYRAEKGQMPIFNVRHIIGQGGAASMDRSFVLPFSHREARMHRTPQRLKPCVTVEGLILTSPHAAYMLQAPDHSIMGDLKEKSFIRIMLEWALSTEEVQTQPELRLFLEQVLDPNHG